MRYAKRIWPAVVFALGGLLVLAGAARAAPHLRGPVYIPPILHQDSQQPDKLLSKAFGDAVALRVPVAADWRLTVPDPAVCRTGCVVIRIAGRRAPSPQYVLQLRSFPRGSQWASTQITGPSNTTPALLADVILLKTSFLLRIELSGERRRAPTVVASSKAAPASPRVSTPVLASHGPHRLDLGISGTALVGVTDTMIAGGVELAAALRLVGVFHLKAAVGYLGNGQVADGLSTFSVMPVHVLAGFAWRWRWFRLGVFAGGSMLAFWVNFDHNQLDIPESTGFTGISFGPTAELQLAVRVHRHVSIGLTTRVTYAPVDLSSYVSDQWQTARFTVPRGLTQSSLDVVFSF
jgi:hypothetical protein